MAKLKSQKEQDLAELTGKLKDAKSVVFADYRGTTVKDLDKVRKGLRKENVFSKVYKMTLVKKAMQANGLDTASVEYKTPVIIAISPEEETAPARVIKNLAKDIKTLSILEGIVEGKIMQKAQVEALGDLPGKDQLRAQLLSVFNGPISAFARLLNAYAKKLGESSGSTGTAEKPVEEATAPVAEAAEAAPAETSAPAEAPAAA